MSRMTLPPLLVASLVAGCAAPPARDVTTKIELSASDKPGSPEVSAKITVEIHHVSRGNPCKP
jgi:hypothetical protein